MLERIKGVLAQRADVHDWTLRWQMKKGIQLYLVGDQTENLRSISTERMVLDVHHDHNGFRGSSSFIILPGELDTLAAKLDEAVFMASLSRNPPYTLPRPAACPDVATLDESVVADPLAAAWTIRDSLLEALATGPRVKVSSIELFLNQVDTRLHNSQGIEAIKSGTEVMVDFVLIAANGHVESEVHLALERRQVADLDLEHIARRYAQYAHDSLGAVLPKTGRYAVLVSDETLENLFEPFLFHASAAAKYRQMSRFALGESIFGDRMVRGDKLTLTSDATIPYGVRTRSFDDEGVAGQQVCLIRAGLLERYWATQRYADYLQIAATGQLGNIVVAPGSVPFAELREGEGTLYHIVAFSDLQPDPVTANFAAEIRLGYRIDGHSVEAIKGGSVSGNVFEAFSDAHLSSETIMVGAYKGPRAIRFRDLTVAGV
ncbi:MAG: metallopeptidase TldD-related protein [Chloroflexi bacterium]|nr:metallopeptidase TldD-related protein [Chloroflexota bacterium]MCL5074742.1 metallopeptidase TldD-related protein [Chloroflexota bacterium]